LRSRGAVAIPGKLTMAEIMYYVPVVLAPVAVFFLLSANRAMSVARAVIYGVNLSMLLLFVYFIALGIYFRSYYMGHFDVYPSLIISRWWMSALLYAVLPLNVCYLLSYLHKKLRTDKKTSPKNL
jgi:hypothetical protein